jgi:hypothetical protein
MPIEEPGVGFDQFSWATVRANQIRSLQVQARADNERAKAAYEDKKKTWVEVNKINRDRGLAISPVPTVPLELVVNDDGSNTYKAFVPALIGPELPPQVGIPSQGLLPVGGPPTNDWMLGQIMSKLLDIEGILKGQK